MTKKSISKKKPASKLNPNRKWYSVKSMKTPGYKPGRTRASKLNAALQAFENRREEFLAQSGPGTYWQAGARGKLQYIYGRDFDDVIAEMRDSYEDGIRGPIQPFIDSLRIIKRNSYSEASVPYKAQRAKGLAAKEKDKMERKSHGQTKKKLSKAEKEIRRLKEENKKLKAIKRKKL